MKTVLVVEDSQMSFAFIRRMLASGTEYSAEYFSKNAENLLEIYEHYRPDIVAMDIVMEGVNGIEMTRMLTKAHPEARVVMLTSMAYQEIQDDAMNAGAIGYIRKPLRLDQMVSAFDKAMETPRG